jgi:uncharacterized protein YjbI with pentapeptide repeats
MGKRLLSWFTGVALIVGLLVAGYMLADWYFEKPNLEAISVSLNAVQRESALVRREQLLAERRGKIAQSMYWIALAIGAGFGFYLTMRRIRASEMATITEHYDRRYSGDMPTKYIEQLSNPKNARSMRVAGVTELRALADAVDPLDTEKHPYRTQVVNLLVESLVNHPNLEILPTIRDQLVEIGPPAIQKVVDRHRERFGILKQDKKIDPEDPAFKASRDTIIRILKKNGAHQLVLQKCLNGEITPHWHRLVARITRSKLSWQRVHRKWLSEWFRLPVVTLSWNKVPPRVVPELSDLNLSGADLLEANLSGADLSYVNLNYANLPYVNFSGANLSYVNLSDAFLAAVNLSSADLSFVNFSDANLRYGNLSNANLWSADLSGAILWSANLSGADLSEVNWKETNNCGAANWWDADITDEQRAWFAEHYPREKNEPEYLEFWNPDATRRNRWV